MAVAFDNSIAWLRKLFSNPERDAFMRRKRLRDAGVPIPPEDMPQHPYTLLLGRK